MFELSIPIQFFDKKEPEAAVEYLCAYVYVYEDGVLVFQHPIPIYKTMMNLSIYGYDRNERIGCDHISSLYFRCRNEQKQTTFSYQVTLIVRKDGKRIGRHTCKVHTKVNAVVVKKKNQVFTVQDTLKHRVGTEYLPYNIQHRFFQDLYISTGPCMAIYIHRFFSWLGKTVVSDYIMLISKMVEFGTKEIWWFMSDWDYNNNSTNDYCDSCIENSGCGDCEDSSHFMVRFIRAMSEIGDQICPNYKELISELKEFEHARLLFCFTKYEEFHCMVVVPPPVEMRSMDRLLFVDSTCPGNVFLGYSRFLNQYKKPIFCMTDVFYSHLEESDRIEIDFFYPKLDF